MVTADYLIAFILYILRRSKLLILRYLCVSKVAQGPFYSINFPSYNLHLLLLFNLPLDPFLQSREGPCEELLSHLYIVLVFLYQAELCWVVLLWLVKVYNDFFAQPGKYTNAFTAMHHADYGPIFKDHFDWFIAVSGKFGKVCNFHFLVNFILLSCH